MIIKTIFESTNSSEKNEQKNDDVLFNHSYTNLLEIVSNNVNNLLKQRTLIIEK